jgi:SAM-dependent methyltransferase
VGRGRQRPWLEDPIGYDALDAFVSGLLAGEEAPAETVTREAEMVYYQPTPARVVLRLIEWAKIGPEDVFFDLGAGLGQVCLLVRLLSGATTHGVEIEPAYVAYARACAARLGLDRADFAAIDARQADYSTGTVFFLYTPFTGHLLAVVLARLRAAAAGRAVRVGAYGPCTAALARQEWLRPLRGGRNDPHAPMVWRSIS